MKVVVLNSKEELKSFPMDQSLKLKFEGVVEDSQYTQCISLLRLPNETGTFNISETYNQSIGYIREKYEVEDTKFSINIENGNSFVEISPVKPLSPGFSYVLFIDKNLSKEFLDVSKIVSKSKSEIEVLTVSKGLCDITVTILSDPKITSTSNKINGVITDNTTDLVTNFQLDLKRSNSLEYSNLELIFKSDLYLSGESFNIVSTGAEPMDSSLFFLLRASITEAITPIENPNKSIGHEDLLNYYSKEENSSSDITKPLETRVVGHNLIEVFYDPELLDLDDISWTSSEAFGMYTLDKLGKYDENKKYSVIVHKILDKSFVLKVEEVV